MGSEEASDDGVLLEQLLEQLGDEVPAAARKQLALDVVQRQFRAGEHVAMVEGIDGPRLVSTTAFEAGITCFLVDHALEFPAAMLPDLPRILASDAALCSRLGALVGTAEVDEATKEKLRALGYQF